MSRGGFLNDQGLYWIVSDSQLKIYSCLAAPPVLISTLLFSRFFRFPFYHASCILHAIATVADGIFLIIEQDGSIQCWVWNTLQDSLARRGSSLSVPVAAAHASQELVLLFDKMGVLHRLDVDKWTRFQSECAAERAWIHAENGSAFIFNSNLAFLAYSQGQFSVAKSFEHPYPLATCKIGMHQPDQVPFVVCIFSQDIVIFTPHNGQAAKLSHINDDVLGIQVFSAADLAVPQIVVIENREKISVFAGDSIIKEEAYGLENFADGLIDDALRVHLLAGDSVQIYEGLTDLTEWMVPKPKTSCIEIARLFDITVPFRRSELGGLFLSRLDSHSLLANSPQSWPELRSCIESICNNDLLLYIVLEYGGSEESLCLSLGISNQQRQMIRGLWHFDHGRYGPCIADLSRVLVRLPSDWPAIILSALTEKKIFHFLHSAFLSRIESVEEDRSRIELSELFLQSLLSQDRLADALEFCQSQSRHSLFLAKQLLSFCNKNLLFDHIMAHSLEQLTVHAARSLGLSDFVAKFCRLRNLDPASIKEPMQLTVSPQKTQEAAPQEPIEHRPETLPSPSRQRLVLENVLAKSPCVEPSVLLTPRHVPANKPSRLGQVCSVSEKEEERIDKADMLKRHLEENGQIIETVQEQDPDPRPTVQLEAGKSQLDLSSDQRTRHDLKSSKADSKKPSAKRTSPQKSLRKSARQVLPSQFTLESPASTAAKNASTPRRSRAGMPTALSEPQINTPLRHSARLKSKLGENVDK